MPDRKASTSHAAIPAAARAREPLGTPRHTTRRRLRHAWLAGLAASLATATGACGGGSRGDSYARATSAQQTCCEYLQGAERDQCLAQLVKVEDPEVASSEANQATYRCVQQHFVCDPRTGHASSESAQAQYDCIAALPD
jgi:hypothetical protein